jgi:hypothetical protein
MTERRPDAHSDERAFDLRVESPLRTAAGSGVRAQLSITNRTAQAYVALVSVVGSDAEWLPRPSRSRPLPPGETIIADVIVAPSPGTVPARYPLALVVEAIDPVTGQPRSSQILDIELIVDAPGQIDLQISPTDAAGVFGKRLHITVRNSGLDPAPVLLDAQTTEAVRVSVPQGEWTLPPGETARLHGRVRPPRLRFFGTPARSAYTMTAHSSGAPRHLDASFTSRAMFGSLFAKLLALIVIVSFWVTMCIIYIPKIADLVRKHEASSAFQTPGTSAPASAGHSGKSGSRPGGSGNGSGHGGSGNGGNGSGNGNGGNGSGNGNGGNGSGNGSQGGRHGGAAAALNTVQLNGTVGGTDPSGVTVSAVRTGLVTEKAVRGTQNPASAASQFSADGMIPASALVSAAPTVQPANPKPVTTGPTGTWSFRVQKPGYYLLTFERAGDETQRYVIDSSTAVATQPIKIVLAPGQGRLQGMVTGPHGAVENATVTITDGTSTITTSTESKGQVGHWSVDGLSTPSSYLVTVTKDGLGAASKLLQLSAGERDGVVNLNLRTGVTMLTGRVVGRDNLGNLCGVGGAQVTVTNGTITRTASTVTGDAGTACRLAGSFRVPGLPPGTYTVTITARDYLIQTQRVVIKPGLVTFDMKQAQLSSAYAQISGSVVGDVLDSEGNREPGGPTKPKVDAGLTLTSITNTYKLTSLNDGTFTFRGVAPGTYVLTAQYPDLDPAAQTVKVKAGDIVNLADPLVLRRAEVINDATIQGFVGDSSDPSNTISCPSSGPAPPPPCTVSFTLKDVDGTIVPTDTPSIDLTDHSIGALPYKLGPTTTEGFAPGLYKLTISVGASYLPATVKVFVPQHGIGRAPPINLTRSNGIAGLITAVDGAPLDQSASGTSYTGRNCVVAIPIVNGVIPTVPPANCTPPTTTTCTDPAAPSEGFSVIQPGGAYQIEGLCDATYVVFVVVKNPDFYGDELTPTSVAVAAGVTVRYSVDVSHKGGIELAINTPNSSGDLTPLANASVDATCGADSRSGTTNASGVITLAALADGSVHCSITATTPSNRTFSGGIDVVINRNKVTQQQLTLTSPIGSVSFHIVTDWTTSRSDVDGATVTVSGITSYVDGKGLSDSTGPQTITGNCFLVGPASDGTTPACPERVAFGFITSTLTVTVSARGFQTTTRTLNNQTAGASTNIVLDPAPVNLSAALTVAPGDPSVDLSRATIQVTDQSPAAGTVGVGVVTPGTNAQCPDPIVSACADISWSDTKAAQSGLPGNAMPGTYTLKITLPGYAPATVDIECQQVGTDCDVPLITLQKFGTLTITTVDDSIGHDAVNDAVVTLTHSGQAAQTQQPDPGTNTVTFASIVSGTYGVQIDAAGYRFYQSARDGTSSVSCTAPDGTATDPLTLLPGVTVSCTVTLTKLGTITGTVEGVRALVGTDPTNLPQDALSGVRLTAQRCDDQTCANPSGPAFSAVTDADGTFTITGTTTTEGLQDGWWYIKPVLSGWTEPAKTDVGNNVFEVLNHETKTVTVHMFTRPVDFEILVLDGSGNPVTSNDVTFTVRDTRRGVPLGQPQAPASPAATPCTQGHSDCHYWVYSQIVPTGYTISIHYSPIGTLNTSVTLIPGATPVLISVQGNATSGSVTGSITALQGTNTSPTPISGVTVALLKDGQVAKAINGTDDLSVTTGSNGFVAIANVPVSNTPYDVRVTPPAGYTVPTTVQAQVLVDTPAAVVPIAPLELVRVTHDVEVTVTTPSVDNLSTLVKAQLTPQGGQNNPSFGTDGLFVLSGGSGSVTNTFQQVPFGNYTLRLTFPDDHRVLPSGCTVVPSNSQACTASASVPNTGSDPVTVTFALDESKITFLVTRDNALPTDDRTPPASVTLTVQHGTSAALYTNSSFDVGGSSAAIWVPDDGTQSLMYHLTATPDASFVGWPAISVDVGRASHTSTDDGFHDWGTSTLNLTESSASISFTVEKHNGDPVDAAATPKIQITLPTGINGPDSVTTDPGGTKTIANVPFASGWSAQATTDNTTYGASVTFAVDASNTTCQTDSSGTTTCSVTLRLPAGP